MVVSRKSGGWVVYGPDGVAVGWTSTRLLAEALRAVLVAL